MNNKFKNGAALEKLLRERIAIIDGAMGTTIRTYGMKEADMRGARFANARKDLLNNGDLFSLTQPAMICDIHRRFLEAGADIIETNTFSATSIGQSEFFIDDPREHGGRKDPAFYQKVVDDKFLNDLAWEINETSARQCREWADRVANKDSRQRFVAGAIGPLTVSLSNSPDADDSGFRVCTFDQVKAAYTTASDLQFTGPLLNRLFHSSFAAGKRVRTETGLGEGAVSVSYAAIALAKKIFGKLSGLSVLVLGAGEMAELTATHLRSQQVRQMTIASRTLASAERLAVELSATAVPWTAIDEAMGNADIVVTATGATDPVLTRTGVEAVMATRRHRPLFVIDIAVPRDVEPAVGDLEQVFLYNIDDLQTIVKENLARRSAELTKAEEIVTDEVTRFVSWMQSRDVIPTVVALRQRFEAIRQSELLRLEPKLASLPPDARAKVDEVTRLIVEKLLLTPTEQLKAVSDEATVAAYAEALNRLFRLAAEEQKRAAPAAAPTGRTPRS